jgi:hypothetical protein
MFFNNVSNGYFLLENWIDQLLLFSVLCWLESTELMAKFFFDYYENF